jgi:hypothetical protein
LAHLELALNEFHSELLQSAANGKDLKKPKMIDKAISSSTGNLDTALEEVTKNTLLNTKRLFFDQSGKPIPEATIQAMKIAL